GDDRAAGGAAESPGPGILVPVSDAGAGPGTDFRLTIPRIAHGWPPHRTDSTSWFDPTRRNAMDPSSPRPPSRRPFLETLVDRGLLSEITATLQSDGTLAIAGTAGDDTISVRFVNRSQFRVTGVTQLFLVNKVHSITINSFAGNDTID